MVESTVTEAVCHVVRHPQVQHPGVVRLRLERGREERGFLWRSLPVDLTLDVKIIKRRMC